MDSLLFSGKFTMIHIATPDALTPKPAITILNQILMMAPATTASAVKALSG